MSLDSLDNHCLLIRAYNENRSSPDTFCLKPPIHISDLFKMIIAGFHHLESDRQKILFPIRLRTVSLIGTQPSLDVAQS